MRRRRFLGTVGAGLLAGTGGCVAGGRSSDADGGSDRRATGTPAADIADGFRDVNLPVEESALTRGAPEDEIPAIVDPAFGEDWSGVTATLGDGDRVIGVTVDGEARAYPLAILNWHEVVNDAFGGPLLVTYCPLCGSGVVADRRVDGRETTFGVSGYLWRRDLVMDDELTGSLWSQILGTAIRGPQTGARLTLRPSALTSWGEWRRTHPETSVLLPPPESGTVTGRGERNYNTNPYGEYEPGQAATFWGADEKRVLTPESLVVGVTAGGTARAYPYATVVEAGGVVNDAVDGLPVVVASTRESLVAYVRRVEGETLTFDREDGDLLAGGSRWRVTSGRASDGPYRDRTLERANDRSPMFWFAWAAFAPGTDVYGESV